MVSINYGRKSMLNADQRQMIDNKIKDLRSMVDVMNFMSTQGWEFVQAYTAENGASMSQEIVFHWLLKKELSEEDEIE